MTEQERPAERSLDRPLVSVITPCLDPGESLVQCLESVAAQTYDAIEHIVVDGGSHDGTVDILKPRPRVRWVSRPDRGQSEALNRGFEMAKGRFVTWLNADDTFFPWTVKTALDGLLRPPGVEWVYGACEIVQEGEVRLWFPPRELTATSFNHENVIPQLGSFFSSRALRAVGGIDESFHLAMDFDLWIRLLDAGISHRFIPKKLATFHIHGSSKTGSLPYADFLLEGARALSKSGRHEASGIMMGRAAAQYSRASGLAVEEELERLSLFTQIHDVTGHSEIMAGALTELAFEPRGDKFRLKYLLNSAPWRHKQTRNLIQQQIIKRGRRLVRRILKRN